MRLRELFEAPATAVMAFGRMNPPTIGHAKLVDAIKSQPGDPFIFLSQSQKPKTDPLSFEDKLRYAKFFFPNVTIGNPEVKTIIQALQKVESLGYQQLIYVAGSDRLQSFEELLNKYNGKDYTFKSIKVVSAGERDPDADGAEGMSASKMRQAAVDNDLESFKQGVPEPKLADEMFAAVRQGMGVRDQVPAESIEEAEVNDLNQLTVSAQQGLQKVKQGDMKGALANMEQIANGLAKLDIGTKMYNFMSKMLSAYEQQVANFPEDPDTPILQKSIDQIQAQMPTFKKQAAQSKQYAKTAKNKELDAFGGLGEAEVTPGQSLPQQIKVIKMPTPPQAPTGPDGTDENGTRIGTTPKGNRSVKSGAGTYIFTPQGKLMLYMTPKIGGLQQTHNIAKQTVTVNFGTSAGGANIDQKATYDMSGKLISGDNTSIKSGTMGVSVDKDKGATVDMTTLSGKKHSINSKDPKKYDKLAALKKDQDQDLNDFKKANTTTLAKMGIKRSSESIGEEKDLDDITLQRVLKSGAEMDMDKQRNPGVFQMVDNKTKALIARARAQAKRDRVTNVPSRAHDKDGVHKQGFKPVKFPKSNSMSNFKFCHIQFPS